MKLFNVIPYAQNNPKVQFPSLHMYISRVSCSIAVTATAIAMLTSAVSSGLSGPTVMPREVCTMTANFTRQSSTAPNQQKVEESHNGWVGGPLSGVGDTLFHF